MGSLRTPHPWVSEAHLTDRSGPGGARWEGRREPVQRRDLDRSDELGELALAVEGLRAL